MGLVMGACHHIHVLDFGQIIAYGTPAEVQANAVVRAAYLGEGDEAEEVPEEQQALLAEVSALQEEVRAETEHDTNGDAPSISVSTAPVTPACPPGAALELIDVRAAYGSIDVLHGVNIMIPRGTVYALLGPNGAGKSTTLKVASGRLNPTGGEVRFLGDKINGRSADKVARAGLCTIPEGRGIFPNLSVLENLRTMTYTGTSLSRIEDQAYTRFPRLKERRKQIGGHALRW